MTLRKRATKAAATKTKTPSGDGHPPSKEKIGARRRSKTDRREYVVRAKSNGVKFWRAVPDTKPKTATRVRKRSQKSTSQKSSLSADDKAYIEKEGMSVKEFMIRKRFWDIANRQLRGEKIAQSTLKRAKDAYMAL